ncbi:MAG: protein kinase domain-containing protein [Actinomycetota bacterium]
MEFGESGTRVDLGIEGISEATQVGRGGFGVVYRARQEALGRTVAVKILSVAVLDQESSRRFERECRALGTLSGHPNIVGLYTSGLSATGHPYLVMDYLPGGSLADRIKREKPLPWTEVAEMGIKLAGALAAAHAAGVLHRDLKPENVLISAYGEPQLVDFGVARMRGDAATRTGLVTGTLTHAAPEVLAGKSASEASDVYSLASTLYALAAGRAAFARLGDETFHPLLTRILSEEPPDLRSMGVPGPFWEALNAAMAKDPGQRTLTASAFGEALRDSREVVGLKPVPGGGPRSGKPPTSPASIGSTLATGRPFDRPSPPSQTDPGSAWLDQVRASLSGGGPLPSPPPASPGPSPVPPSPSPPPVGGSPSAGGPPPSPPTTPGWTPPPPAGPDSESLTLFRAPTSASSSPPPAAPPHSPFGQAPPRQAPFSQPPSSTQAPPGQAPSSPVPFTAPQRQPAGKPARPQGLLIGGGIAALVALIAAAVFVPKVLSGSGSKDAEKKPGRTSNQGAGPSPEASPPSAQAPALSSSPTPGLGEAVPPARVSPGKRIVFTSLRDGNREIYIVNDDGTDLKNLTGNGATDTQPAFSPDGTTIAFMSNRGGNEDIYLMSSDGSGVRRLTNNPSEDITPAWSPDGTRIAFARKDGASSLIYVINADGSKEQRLIFNLGSHPAWSPDGQKIAFANLTGEIVVINADGSGEVRVTQNAAQDLDPDWSPDGRLFFATEREGPASRVYAMKVDGSDQKRVTNGGSPAWSQQSNRLVFIRDGNVFLRDAGGQEKAITSGAKDEDPDW